MATVVHKTTFQHLHSVNTPDYPAGTWLRNPAGLAALEADGIASKYWKLISGDTDVGEMTAQEKFDVDAAEPATVNSAVIVTVTANPEVTAVDAVKGSLIIWGCLLYIKQDDGPTTNVAIVGQVNQRDTASGGALWCLVPYSADPAAPKKNDLWLREVDGKTSLLFYNGAEARILAMSPVPFARVYRDALQGTTHNVAKILDFTNERWDNDNIHDNLVNNSRLYARTAGKYIISASVTFDSNSSGKRRLSLKLDGGDLIANKNLRAMATGKTSLTISTTYELNEDQYIEVSVYQDSGGNLDIMSYAKYSPEFSILWAGG